MRLLFLLLVAFIQQEVPYKAVDDFDVILDYQFKTYKEKDPKTVDYSSHNRRETGPLLYLVANVKLKKIAANEFRIRVANNLASLANKKVEQDMIIKIDFGFIVDVKDRITAHEYTISLLSPEKIEV